MNAILTLALALVVVWFLAKIVFGVVGFLVHVLLLIGAVLFVVWLWRKLTGSSTGTTDTTP